MTLNQFIRAAERSARAAHRDAERRSREAERYAIAAYKQNVKMRQKMEASAVVWNYDKYVETLVGYHRSGVNFFDWHALAQSSPPPAPARQNQMEFAAMQALNAYQPTFFDRLLKRDRVQKEELEIGVMNARLSDDRMFGDAQREYAERYRSWEEDRELAQRVVSRDVSTYPEVLDSFGILAAFSALGVGIRITAVSPEVVALAAAGAFVDQIVPQEELKLTSTGKVSSKNMAKAKYWALMQDHVCSCALRIACDALNVLPIDRVIVNVGEARLSSVTGHPETVTLVGGHFTRAALQRINFNAIDPSDSMANFNVRMEFHKTKGFTPVEPVTPEDHWITAS